MPEKAQKPLTLVAGAGAGLGQPILARFEQGGLTPVGLGQTAPNSAIGAIHALDPANMMKTADIAEACRQIAQQPKSTWSDKIDRHPAAKGL